MAESVTTSTIFLSLVAGVIPPLLWLWFWLREDRKNPEPRSLILMTFLAGMVSVFPTYFIQQYIKGAVSYELALLVLWPLTEEIAKFSTAFIVALRTKEYDEPIDAIVYLITAALGFSAMENFFFLIKPEFSTLSLITANMRFVGATLLHLLSSASIGIFIAFTFHKSKINYIIGLILGLLTATMLHSLFNIFIIKDGGQNILYVFTSLWLLIVVLLLFLEKIKSLKY